MAFICLQYDLESLLYAAGITFIVCLLVSLFSASTSVNKITTNYQIEFNIEPFFLISLILQDGHV